MVEILLLETFKSLLDDSRNQINWKLKNFPLCRGISYNHCYCVPSLDIGFDFYVLSVSMNVKSDLEKQGGSISMNVGNLIPLLLLMHLSESMAVGSTNFP